MRPAGAVADRTEAERLVNTRLLVDRNRLPTAGWRGVLPGRPGRIGGAQADGLRCGQVSAVHDYGAGTSLEIARAQAAR